MLPIPVPPRNMSRRVITVNQFDFCSEHGNELCYVCDQDYRSLNNKSADIKGRLSTKLGPNFEIDNGFLLEVGSTLGPLVSIT